MFAPGGLLGAPTDPAWFEAAVLRVDDLLIDHANCEKKAASTALSIMFAYPEDFELADRMSRLAREELRHFELAAPLPPLVAADPVPDAVRKLLGWQPDPARLPGAYALRTRASAPALR